MKKILFLLSITSLFFISQFAYACSPVAGAVYPSPESVLSKDDTAIGVYKMTANGNSVPALLVVGNENSSMNMIFEIDGTSCSNRFDDFKKDEYVVTIFNKDDTLISHSDLDAQFSYPFNVQSEAMAKYNLLYDIWENRTISIGETNENGEVYYIVAGKTLSPGMKNDSNVLALQTALKVKLNLGNDFKLDSSYGPATQSAVKQFQKANGLEDDGIAGPLTQTKLAGTLIGEEVVQKNTAYVASESSLKIDMKNNEVKMLQEALKVKLNLGDDFVVDGSYGPMTESVVKQFQRDNGLEDDGIAGALTQAKLVGVLIPFANSDNNKESTEEDSSEHGEVATSENVEIENTEVDSTNDDIINSELRNILIRAKKEIIHYALGDKNYTNAYELVAGYNNTFLNTYESSDPLYKSSGGGTYFVYSVKLKNGEYLCADNNYQKEIVQKTDRPDMNTDQVAC
jgi:peptidoglycan hydrolase-like protein with peptidoglycan-binding domain